MLVWQDQVSSGTGRNASRKLQRAVDPAQARTRSTPTGPTPPTSSSWPNSKSMIDTLHNHP